MFEQKLEEAKRINRLRLIDDLNYSVIDEDFLMKLKVISTEYKILKHVSADEHNY